MKNHKFTMEKNPTKTEELNVFDIKFLTLKDIINFCHVSYPREIVLSVQGRSYPKDEVEYHKLFSDEGKFDPSKAGKRM